MNPSIAAGINAALGLITAGTEIVTLLKDKDSLTEEELQAIIDKNNKAQEEARAALVALLNP